jgi:hypothetical protein
MAGYGGGGCDDQDVSSCGVGAGSGGAGFDDAEDRDGGGGADLVESEGAGGVTGDDQIVGALIDQKPCAFNGIAGDRRLRFRTVGEARGVAEIEVAGFGELAAELAKNG